jgi:DNA-directed RNA polymerase I subunit RPA49
LFFSNTDTHIATTPGINVPSSTRFETAPTSKKNDLVLKSTSHPRLDYTAREEGQSSSEPHLKHYLGLYNPKTGELELIEAKKMVVRATVRDNDAREAEAEDVKKVCNPMTSLESVIPVCTKPLANAAQSMMDLKTDLGQTFGTKKAKKVIQENVLNAISSPKKPGEESSPTKINKAAKAMLQSVGDITSTMASREELQAVVNEAKPVPPANMDADEIEDVYDPREIIGSEILNLVPVREWQEMAKHKESIQTSSRFVAARINPIALNENAVDRLRVLRYLYFTILFYLHTTLGREKGVRRLPPREKLRELLAPAPEAVIENIRRKFSDGGQMRQFHIHLLMTHCCAFAAIVDNFEVDMQNLKDDLRLEQKRMSMYFREIGAKVKQITSKEEGRTIHLAQLGLPLEFPQQRHIVPKRR